MSGWRSFLSQVRRVPADQLAARASLTLKRRLLASRVGPWLRPRDVIVPAASTRPPLPPFPPRRDQIVIEDGLASLSFLNVSRPLTFPVDWHPPEWARDPQLELLHLHYTEWTEGLDDARFVAVVEDWIANVRPYGPLYWRGAWNSYAVSIRVVVWMQQLAVRARRLSPAFLETARRSLAEQLAFLESNLELDIRGNHLLKNVKALAWGGAFFEGPTADRWRRRAESLLRRELAVQFLPDGLHFERSPAYHAQACADLVECRVALGECATSRLVDATLERAMQALVDVVHPDGRVSLFSDGGLEMAYAPDVVLAAWQRLSDGKTASRPHVTLESAGYYGWRDGRTLFLFDCGDLAAEALPAHGHGDALSFEWTVHGERVFVDAGVFEYRPGDMRAWSRSTRAHNTVTLDDVDQGEFVGSFRLGRRARVERTRLQLLPDGIVVEGLHDGFEHLPGAPLHRRLVRATTHELRVEDRIEGGAGQRACARLLCHPSARVTQSRDGVVTIQQGRVAVRVTSESPITVTSSWWCPDFGLKLRTKQIVIDYGTAPRVGSFQARSLVTSPHEMVTIPRELVFPQPTSA